VSVARVQRFKVLGSEVQGCELFVADSALRVPNSQIPGTSGQKHGILNPGELLWHVELHLSLQKKKRGKFDWKDDITTFREPTKAWICWSYIRF